MKLGIATRNAGKVREIRRVLEGLPVEVVLPDEAWIAPPEDAPTYEENAVAKARSLADHLGIPAVADDSGIEVEALGGEPGPRSARFAGEGASDEENLAALIAAIASVPEAERGARYRCVAALVSTGGDVITTEGVVEGKLITEPRGGEGFGYDPIFVPAGESRTMAELTKAEKERISHRGRAFRALRSSLESLARR